APSAAAAAAATASIGQLVSPSDLPMAGGGPAPGDASKSAASDSVTSPSPARATSRHPSRSGSPMGLLGGVLLVGGIGAAAGLRARRGR
ncbi:MAG: hypothetical protein M3Z02_05395, partial [Actinomycetota bacterium]|nr:hypothetical protein [Actinomycetota bacterium]